MDNYRLGIMTNELILGPDHEDLVTFEHFTEITHIAVIVSMAVVTIALLAIVMSYKIAVR